MEVRLREWVVENRAAVIISVGIFVVGGVLVGVSLGREAPEAFAPSELAPREVGERLVGPVRVTIDASAPDRWVFFDFSRGAPVRDPDPLGWDVAFRRFNVTVNGGPGFAGQGGAVELGDVPLSRLDSVPAGGYVGSDARRDSVTPAMDRWYDYGFTSHLLTPKARTWAVRTADGRYAAVRFVSYYCPGARAGCLTLEYVYQGDGSRRMR